MEDSTVIEHRGFDESQYEKATNGVDYSEEYRPKEKPIRRGSRKNTFDGPNLEVLGELFQVIAVVFVALVLGFLLFRLIDEKYLSGRRDSSKAEDVLFDKLEERIHDVDLENLLRKALDDKNYKMAIRIYYLIIIKGMSNAELINWKKDKTNGEYVSELYGKKHFEPFKEATLLFERAWYGNVDVDLTIYNKLQPKFDALNKKIKPLNKLELE